MGIAIYAIAFYVIVSVFARGLESSSRWKILVVSLVSTLTMGGVSGNYPTLLGTGIAALSAAAVAYVLLVLWLKAARAAALKISSTFVAFIVVWSVFWTVVITVFFKGAA